MSSETRSTATPSHRIAPWLSVAHATAAVAFYEAAFGAVELERIGDGAGGVTIAQLAVGPADFWVQQDDVNPLTTGVGSTVRMILTVDDPDAVFARALGAGAVEVAAVHEAHGWRVGRLADPSGHHWEVGRRLP